jgi:hypothetical protein
MRRKTIGRRRKRSIKRRVRYGGGKADNNFQAALTYTIEDPEIYTIDCPAIEQKVIGTFFNLDKLITDFVVLLYIDFKNTDIKFMLFKKPGDDASQTTWNQIWTSMTANELTVFDKLTDEEYTEMKEDIINVKKDFKSSILINLFNAYPKYFKENFVKFQEDTQNIIQPLIDELLQKQSQISFDEHIATETLKKNGAIQTKREKAKKAVSDRKSSWFSSIFKSSH